MRSITNEVFIDQEELIEKLSSDVRMSKNVHDLIPITVYSRVDVIQANHNSNDHLRFLFYQLFIRQYCLNSPSLLNKDDFMDLVHDYYSSNRKESKTIEQFDRDYVASKNCFSWFMRDCFLRRMLTQSLLTLNIKVLFSLRFFIRDLFKIMIDKAVVSVQKQKSYSYNAGRYLNGRSMNEQIFYRGQALSDETFVKIKTNVGKKN